MNDILERYLGAVCSYFVSPIRNKVYLDLKSQIQASAKHYDDLEDLLISYGHPYSIALSYGYRPMIQHRFNSKVVALVERIVFFISGIYLFFSTLYYLQQLNCLPFQTSSHVAIKIDTSNFFTWMLSHPVIIMIIIGMSAVLTLLLLEFKYPADQEMNLKWTTKELYELPHQSHYPKHNAETIIMVIFSLFFFIYHLYFSSDIIVQVQHNSFQMIHLMTYFFQPFMMMIYFDFVIDLSKKIYTKKYLKYSCIINIFILVSLITFIINSSFLKDYLLPFTINTYVVIDLLIIGAMMMISFVSLYKIIRSIRSYRFLFKK